MLGRGHVTCWRISKILEFLDVKSLHSHRLALVSGTVDDGAAATLAQDAAFILTVLQVAVLQEKPVHTQLRGQPG